MDIERMKKRGDIKRKISGIQRFIVDKKIIPGIIAIVVIAIILMVAGKAMTVKGSPSKEGYKSITDVDGVIFDVKKDLSDTSTAVLEISDKVDFIDYQTYSYKNGEDTYILFNIQNFIVIVKKGTSFNFAQGGVEASLLKNSMDGIWFNPIGEEYRTTGKYSVEVEAQVVITNNLYNDFYGKLTTLTKGGVEWSLFVGTVDTASETLRSTIDVVTESFNFYERVENNTGNYEVSLENGSFSEIEENKEPVSTPTPVPTEAPTPTPAPTATPTAEPTASPVVTETPEPEATPVPTQMPTPTPTAKPTATPAVTPAPTETPVPTQMPTPTPTPKATEIPADSVSDNDAETKEPDKELVEIEEEDRFSIANNQADIVLNDSSAYTSSEYFMLSIGNIGYMNVFSEEILTLEGAFIKPTFLFNEEETQELIDAYCESGLSYYDTMTAPDGCHFEAIAYDVKYETGKDYTNIRLCGLDGEQLRFRGIQYSQRTYDILSDNLVNGWYCDNICFYAVPNGCKEYSLKCGSGTDTNGGYNAFYHIKWEAK